jgi:hypothetical protein
MPNPKGALPSSSRKGNVAVKPVPPPDLWEQIESDMAALAAPAPLPEGAFRVKELMERFGLTINQANRKLQVLQSAGKMKRFGHGKTSYYMRVTPE